MINHSEEVNKLYKVDEGERLALRTIVLFPFFFGSVTAKSNIAKMEKKTPIKRTKLIKMH